MAAVCLLPTRSQQLQQCRRTSPTWPCAAPSNCWCWPAVMLTTAWILVLSHHLAVLRRQVHGRGSNPPISLPFAVSRAPSSPRVLRRPAVTCASSSSRPSRPMWCRRSTSGRTTYLPPSPTTACTLLASWASTSSTAIVMVPIAATTRTPLRPSVNGQGRRGTSGSSRRPFMHVTGDDRGQVRMGRGPPGDRLPSVWVDWD
jgi:hypothetical protein